MRTQKRTQFTPHNLLLVGLIFMYSLLLAGCWDRREVQSLAFITATGVDPVTDAEAISHGWPQFELSARVINTIGSELAGGSGGEKNLPSTVLKGRGVTPWNALLDIQKRLGWLTFSAHNRVVVISSDIPRSGQLVRVMDFFDRSRLTRRAAVLLIADDLSAYEVVNGYSPLTGPGRSSLYELVRINHEVRGAAMVTIHDFLVKLSLEGIDPIAGRVTSAPVRDQAGQESTDSLGGEPGGESSSLASPPGELTGVALFQGDRLVGFLEEGETQGLLWALNNIQRSFVNVPCPGHPDYSFLFNVQRSSGRISIDSDPELKGKIRIVMEGNIGDMECPNIGLTTATEAVAEAHRSLKQYVEARVRSAVDRAQELQSDPFGFGAALMRSQYKHWEEVRERWYDSIWPELPVDIVVEAHIRRPGIIGPSYQVLR